MNGARATQTAVSPSTACTLEPTITGPGPDPEERPRDCTQSWTPETYSTRSSVVDIHTNRFGIDPQIAAIQRARLFSDLSAGDCAQLACLGRKRHYGRHESLFRQGDTVQHVCLIVTGILKITYVGSDGEEVILSVRGPGDLLGVGLPTGRLSECNAETMEAASVLLWDAGTMKDLEARFPVLRHRAFELLHDQLQEMQQRFRELATEKVALRVARAVVRAFTAAQRHRPGIVHVTLSREELAQMTGTTVFAVSRLLAEWTKGGIIDAGRRFIVVHNSTRLLEHAARGSSIAA